MSKSINVKKDVWKKLSILKIRLGKRNLSDTIEYLLECFEKINSKQEIKPHE